SRTEVITIHKHILEPEFQWVNAQLCSQDIHGTLRSPDRLHRSKATESTIGRQVCIYAMGIDPDMWNAIWSNGSIAHLLGHTWSTVSIGPCIDPAFNPLSNKSPI